MTNNQEHDVRKAQDDPILGPFISKLPPQQRSAVLSLIKQLGFEQAKNTFFPNSKALPEAQDLSNGANDDDLLFEE